MNQTIKIAPSVLSADFAQLGAEVQRVASAGAQQIHIDVMDGRFVPNITMGPLIVEAIRRVTDLPLDVHLMIVEPEKHLAAFAEAGATALTVHLETCPHLHRTLQQIRDLGLQAGVAINPHTPATHLSEILHMVDIVLVMTVNPGFGGQQFIAEMLPKIRAVRQMVGVRPVDIGVDGGIDATTAPQALKAGANVLIAGNAIFKHVDGMAAIQGAVEQYRRSRTI
ncbi:MAG: ribulose-phosphate 3-epimerase [Anaerolineales bacterium]|nr:ribulose-phosphate 3-epimerase [Anaerolineales bacterium]